MTPNRQIDEIYTLLMHLASGNLDYRASLGGLNDELDAITLGINTLAEEMQVTTVSRNYLNSIYEGVADMLFVLDHDLNIKQANEQAVKKLLYSQEELLTRNFIELLKRKTPTLAKSIEKALLKNRVWNSDMPVFLTKSGKPIAISITASILHSTESSIPDILIVAKDISQIKLTQENLRSKNHELNTFIYRASHDLKGPLSSILGLLNLAQTDQDDPASLRTYLTMIRSSAERLDNILEEFLELGRITQSKVTLEIIDFEKIIIGNKEDLSHRYADAKNLCINYTIQGLTPFKNKSILVRTIIQNLMDNAVKYSIGTSENPSVHIDIKIDEKSAIIKVSDNGLGIDKKHQEKIFNMFYRGNNVGKGLGLGLYIVKSSVDAMHGKIKVKSNLDQGTTFQINLPNCINR
ncbi:MAG: PAS domain-containing sensor histidine kinase [Bacteroidota bacterium]|nr:PAS domain-containing sensor histidine kinase [Bacteroidota bacterium]